LYSKIGKTSTKSIGALNLSGIRRRSEGSGMTSRPKVPACCGFVGWDNSRGFERARSKESLANDKELKTTRKPEHAANCGRSALAWIPYAGQLHHNLSIPRYQLG